MRTRFDHPQRTLRLAGLALALLWVTSHADEPRLAFAPSVIPSAGFRRLSRDEVVEHEVRRALLARISAAPGITVGTLASLENLDYKTVSHHARVLGEFRMVERRVDGRFHRLFPVGGGSHPHRAVHEASGTGSVVEMLRLLASEPGMHPAALARRLGLAKSTVKWHTDRLAAKGILLVRAGSGGVSLEVHPRFAAAIGSLRGPQDGAPAS